MASVEQTPPNLGLGEGQTPAALADFELRSPYVLSKVRVYSHQGIAERTPPPDGYPVPISAFDQPIARYRVYAVGQLKRMEGQLRRLEAALAADQRDVAKNAWRSAYSDYLRLGAVYLDGQTALDERVARLNDEIDDTANGLAGGVSNPRFAGLHRIEFELWTGRALSALTGYARSLTADVRKLNRVLPLATLTPLDYATRAHEILEDAARDFLSGMDVPWSHEGVLATDAALQATEEVIGTLAPVLGKSKRAIPVVDDELARVRSVFAALTAEHGGLLPSNDELTQQQREALDGALGGALEALSRIPGALETESTPISPEIPSQDFMTDPSGS